MTTADRVNARGRSLSFEWGTLPPNAPSRPSPFVYRGRAAGLSTPDSDVQRGEYTTYAPEGEKCRRCRKPFGRLEPVRRVRPTGEPSGRPYVHIECAAGGEA